MHITLAEPERIHNCVQSLGIGKGIKQQPTLASPESQPGVELGIELIEIFLLKTGLYRTLLLGCFFFSHFQQMMTFNQNNKFTLFCTWIFGGLFSKAKQNHIIEQKCKPNFFKVIFGILTLPPKIL